MRGTAAGAWRAWRMARTGLAFAGFGAGAVLAGLAVLPLLGVLAGSRQARVRRAQRTVHQAFRLFLWFSRRLGLLRVRVSGSERLRRGPCLVIANHPTLIDVVLIVAHMPQADCVVKRAAWRNPVLRGVVTAADYIPNGQGEDLVRACVERLRQGRSVLLFPEGTRSPGGRLGPFHRGAARIAMRSGCPLVPAVIRCEPPALAKGQRWYDVPDRTIEITLRVEPSIPVPAARAERPALAARRLTSHARAFYERQLDHARA